jgi:hypothetical protein
MARTFIGTYKVEVNIREFLRAAMTNDLATQFTFYGVTVEDYSDASSQESSRPRKRAKKRRSKSDGQLVKHKEIRIRKSKWPFEDTALCLAIKGERP